MIQKINFRGLNLIIMITIDELKNLDNLSSCILSDTFETIAKAVEINTNGIIIILIKFPINVIKKSNMKRTITIRVHVCYIITIIRTDFLS